MPPASAMHLSSYVNTLLVDLMSCMVYTVQLGKKSESSYTPTMTHSVFIAFYCMVFHSIDMYTKLSFACTSGAATPVNMVIDKMCRQLELSFVLRPS